MNAPRNKEFDRKPWYLIWGLFLVLVGFALFSGWQLSSGKNSTSLYDYAAFCLIALILGTLMALDFLYTTSRLEVGAHPDREHYGISGFRRSIMGLGLILIFGWVLFRLLTHYIFTVGGEKTKDIVQNAVGILEGILATLTGFYFGGRALSSTRVSNRERDEG